MSKTVIRYLYDEKELPRNRMIYLIDTRSSTRVTILPPCENPSLSRKNAMESLSFEDFLASAPRDAVVVFTGLVKSSLELELVNQGFKNLFNAALLPGRNYLAFVIEVTTLCNLKCEGCSRSVGIRNDQWLDKHMSFDTYSRMLDHLPDGSGLILHGVGEPSLLPDYDKFIDHARQRGRFGTIWTTTNGLTRGVDYFKNLVDLGLSGLTLSMDTLSQNLADKLRKGTNIEKLKNFTVSLHKSGIDNVINITVSKSNLHDLENTLSWLDSIGNFRVNFSPFQEFDVKDGQLDKDGMDVFNTLVSGNFKKFKNLKYSFSNTLGPPPDEAICTAPWRVMGINFDGYLTPCCVSWTPDLMGYSDLKINHFSDIWRGETMQKYLRDYMEEEPEYCTGCQANWREVKRQRANGEAPRPFTSIVSTLRRW